MTNKGICEIPLFDPILPKMDFPLFGVTTVTSFDCICFALASKQAWPRLGGSSRSLYVCLAELALNIYSYIA